MKAPKELYGDAYICFDSGDVDEALKLTRILLKDFPKSKEARWALRNFPVRWDKEHRDITIDEQELLATDRFLLMILSYVVFVILFKLLPDRNVSTSSIFLISIFVSGLVAGYLYRRRQGEHLYSLFFISLGYYFTIFYIMFGVLSLLFNAIIENAVYFFLEDFLAVWYFTLLWMASSFLGVLIGQGIRKLAVRDNK